MQRFVFVSSVIFLAAACPALAAEEFWVSQDPTNKTCSVVSEKPDGKTSVIVGATSYPSWQEARAAKKAAADAGQCAKKKS
jgi:hypothetical protein